jgi:hypothetical protein
MKVSRNMNHSEVECISFRRARRAQKMTLTGNKIAICFRTLHLYRSCRGTRRIVCIPCHLSSFCTSFGRTQTLKANPYIRRKLSGAAGGSIERLYSHSPYSHQVRRHLQCQLRRYRGQFGMRVAGSILQSDDDEPGSDLS